MDFLVSEMEKDMLTTEALDDETYPGLKIYEMTAAQAEAVKEVVDNNKHLSPIISDDESYVESDVEEGESVDTPSDVAKIPITTVVPASDLQPLQPPTKLLSPIVHTIPTLPTPNIFSKIPEDKFVEELREEVSQLRKKVAMSANMKTLMAKLSGLEDLSFQTEVIKNYSKRKFQLVLSNEDFEALSAEQIQAIYKKTRESEKSDKFELIYKTAFDFGVTTLEQIINRYCFQVNHLSEYLLYEDISHELNDFKQSIETTVLGKYVDHTSPIARIISYIIIQITRAKLKV